MQRWVIAGLVVMLLGIAMFMFGGSEPPSVAPVQLAKAAVEPSPSSPPIAAVTAPVVVPAQKRIGKSGLPILEGTTFPDPLDTPSAGKLDPKSDAFIELVDEIIPRKIYGQVADRCYQQNFPDWQKIKLSIKERSVDGHFMITDVSVISSNIEDERMKSCIIAAVKAASWKQGEMPDWEDEDELFIRVSGMKKYLDLADEEEE